MIPFDDDQCYTLNIWVESSKTQNEFERSLSSIITPIEIHNHRFSMGQIEASIVANRSQSQPVFEGVPNYHYSHRIDVEVVDYEIWASLDKVFAFAIASRIRTKFTTNYLMTVDEEIFVQFSGTNKPQIINSSYPPWNSGELTHFLQIKDKISKLDNPKKCRTRCCGE